METSITILGGDLRQCYTAEYFRTLGWQVTCWHTPKFPFHPGILSADSLSQAMEQSKFVLGPAPLTRDGISLFQSETVQPPCPLNSLWTELASHQTFAASSLSEEQQQTLQKKGCQILNYGMEPSFVEENAALTAEGLLAEVIRYTPFSLSSANILLLGYGHCGSAISALFRPLCRAVYLAEQDAEKQKAAKENGINTVSQEELCQVLPQCQIVINTVPSAVLEPGMLPLLHHSCHIFDIASAPYGFPPDTTRNCLLPCYRLPGIPGRFSPVTAGELIGRTIERMTEHVL